MKNTFWTKLTCFIIAGVLISVFSFAQVTAADRTELKMVSFVPKMNMTYQIWERLFLKKINEQNGEVSIKYRGGPEVIKPFGLAKAVSRGVIDMALVPTSFYTGVVPGADTMRLSEISVQEERENGTYELQRRIHANANLYFLGHSSPLHHNFFWTVLSKPVANQDDFKGLKLGASPPFFPCFSALGATPVKASLGEYYPMVERGVTDGNVVGLDVYLAIGEYEVAPYVINHPYYRSTNVVIINLDAWNKLSPNAKKMLTNAQIRLENLSADVWKGQYTKTKEKLIANGAKFITLSPNVANWYLSSIQKAGWEFSEKRYPNDVINEFKRLITK